VPIDLPQPKHLHIEAAYVPAAEVGGDFYQVAQGDDDSTLLIVGDVSGKGLKAAMKGTLAIGAFRALAGQGLGPAELLNRLNRELLSGLDGGFITCVCARVTADGVITLANAGHIPPYVNGKEVECVSGFPLGILVTGYSEITLSLKPGDQMTLMSDGVVEAQNAKGELFGFDRTAALSALSAGEIARAAQHFGQEDDITVLTMALLPG
jgi:serine phosphatase RsbU (regulator of sigma subunit)